MAESASSSISKGRIVVLISGGGTNLQAILDAAGTSRLPNGEVIHVISNRSKVFGLERAAKHNPPIPTTVLALKTYLNKHNALEGDKVYTREDYDLELAKVVLATKPDLIVLAGFMHILSPAFLSHINPIPSTSSLPSIPIINLHPALPGTFDGASAIPRAFDAFKKGEITKTGVMVHRVIPEVDQGEPLVVREIFFLTGEGDEEDTLEKLEARMHEAEHEIIVDGADLVLEERLKALKELKKPHEEDKKESSKDVASLLDKLAL